MTMNKELHHWDDVERVYISRKERGREFASIQTAFTGQYNGLKIIYKSVEEDWLHPPETILKIWDQQNDNNQKTKNGKKSKSMDVLSN